MTIDLSTERAAAAWMLASFVVVFLATRVIVRMIRAGRGPFGDTAVGGVHVHHLVYGVFAMLLAGAAEFAYRPASPWVHVLAAVFGAGAALTLDEFALWLRLEDVYWNREGRVSVDAVVLTAAALALVALGANPFDPDLDDGTAALLASVLGNGAVVLAALVKGRIALGLLGLLVPVLALAGALRLARPGSPWARWRYPDGSPKALRSRDRFAGRRTWWDSAVEAVTGRPDPRAQAPRDTNIG